MWRQSAVIFHDKLKCFWNTETKTKLRGITSLLKQTFYPSFKYPKLVQASKRPRSKTYGMRRGTTVDRQITKLAKGDTVRKLHPFTEAAWSAMIESGLRPVDGQVVVFDAEANIATAVDVLCLSDLDKPVLVELKCSSHAEKDTTTQKMRGCLQDHYSCLPNQYQLQAAITRILFEKTYGTKASSYVLHVSDFCTRLTRVPRLEVFERAYGELTEYASTAPPAVRRPRKKFGAKNKKTKATKTKGVSKKKMKSALHGKKKIKKNK